MSLDKSKIKSYRPPKLAHMTGIETEGELAGEIVCPIIYLWKLAAGGIRAHGRGKIEHGAAVRVEKQCTSIMGEVLYRVRSKEKPRLSGWVTAAFVEFDNG